MKQSIVEVIVYLLEMASLYPLEMARSEANPIIIKKELEEAGFSKHLVTDAFDWLKELIEQQKWYANDKHTNTRKANKTLRIFSFEESSRFDLEVRNFILSLEYAGILDTKMREIVISQLMQLNQHQIELVDAKWVVLLVLMSKYNKNAYDLHGYLLATMAEAE